MLVEAPRDLLVGRVEAQREVRGQHGGRDALLGVVGMGHRSRARPALGLPLMGAGRALGQLPLVAEQVLEEAVAPLRRRRGPGDFQAAGDRVRALARAEAALPAETLLFERGALRLGTHVGRRAGAVGLAEGVTSGDERHRLLVVHRHAGEGLADVLGRRDRIRVAVGALRVDVDQAHLDRRERVLEIPGSGVALVVQPLLLGAPVDVLLRLPDVRAPAAEAEGLESHRFQRDVAGQDHEVGPRDLPAVLLLDRPEQPARLVEADVVGPAVDGREALLAGSRAPATVTGAIRARAVPGHADEQRPVVPEVRRPPLLRVGHQRVEVLLHGLEVEALELLCIVEALVHRIGEGGMLVQGVQPQLARPPVTVRRAAASGMIDRAFWYGLLATHRGLLPLSESRRANHLPCARARVNRLQPIRV